MIERRPPGVLAHVLRNIPLPKGIHLTAVFTLFDQGAPFKWKHALQSARNYEFCRTINCLALNRPKCAVVVHALGTTSGAKTFRCNNRSLFHANPVRRPLWTGNKAVYDSLRSRRSLASLVRSIGLRTECRCIEPIPSSIAPRAPCVAHDSGSHNLVESRGQVTPEWL